MKKIKINLFLVLMLAIPVCLWSQALSTVTSGEEAKEIVINESGIYAAAKDIFDTLTVAGGDKDVVYEYSDDVKSFWYKIYVTVDSKITFEIYPSYPGNRYNYFLYQHKGDLSIDEIHTTDIAPVRANLYADEMENGTGLSLSSSVSSNDSCPQDISKIWYHTPYQSALAVSAGDVLLLNVYHLNGSDCGQHLILKDNNHAQEFQSIYETCYNQQIALKKVEHYSGMDVLAEAGKEKGLWIVNDSIRNSRIESAVICMEPCKKIDSTVLSKKEEDYVVTHAFAAIPGVKIKIQEQKRENIRLKVSDENREEAGLVSGNIFSSKTKELSPPAGNNPSAPYSKITDIVVWALLSGFAMLILFLAVLDKRNRKAHSDEAV